MFLDLPSFGNTDFFPKKLLTQGPRRKLANHPNSDRTFSPEGSSRNLIPARYASNLKATPRAKKKNSTFKSHLTGAATGALSDGQLDAEDSELR